MGGLGASWGGLGRPWAARAAKVEEGVAGGGGWRAARKKERIEDAAELARKKAELAGEKAELAREKKQQEKKKQHE